MKWHQKPYTKTKVIDRGKKSKTLTEVKPAENINKNPENFLTIVPCKRKVPPSHKFQDHVYE